MDSNKAVYATLPSHTLWTAVTLVVELARRSVRGNRISIALPQFARYVAVIEELEHVGGSPPGSFAELVRLARRRRRLFPRTVVNARRLATIARMLSDVPGVDVVYEGGGGSRKRLVKIYRGREGRRVLSVLRMLGGRKPRHEHDGGNRGSKPVRSAVEG